MSTGQWMTPDDGPRWFFDAGAEGLDFVYADLGSPQALGRWLADRTPRLNPDDVGDRELADGAGLRTAIGRLYAAAADAETLPPDDVDTVNLFAATPDIPPALAGGRRQAGAARVRVGEAYSSLARETVGLLSAGEGRVRRCGDATCRMVFHDESRTNNRRWCSMERCGNRAKVRAHRERAAMKRVSTRGLAAAAQPAEELS